VAGYRSIRNVRLKLGAINVLTGPNASGKSNLYKSIFLLAKAAAGGFAQVIAAEGGMPSVLWAGARKGKSITSSRTEPVRMKLGIITDSFNYELICGLPRLHGPVTRSAFALDPEVKEERVWMQGAGGLKITFFERSAKGVWILDRDERLEDYSGELLPAESVLSQLREPHLYPELSVLASQMGQWRFYHHFRTDPDSPLRHPQVGVRTAVLGHDGADLAAALQTIIETGDAAELHRAIDQAIPGASLQIEYDEKDGMFGVLLNMPGLKRPLRARELSDGTLRYLCLLAALLSPIPPALLAINEPETSLHPDLLDPLARQLVNAAKNSQLMAGLVEKYSGQPPIRLELKDGETQVAGQELEEESE